MQFSIWSNQYHGTRNWKISDKITILANPILINSRVTSNLGQFLGISAPKFSDHHFTSYWVFPLYAALTWLSKHSFNLKLGRKLSHFPLTFKAPPYGQKHILDQYCGFWRRSGVLVITLNKFLNASCFTRCKKTTQILMHMLNNLHIFSRIISTTVPDSVTNFVQVNFV